MTNNKQLAPIVLMVFARPDHTRKTIDALQNNRLASESDLYIYADAARHEHDLPKVNEVRELIKNIQGFKSVNIVERETNWGLAKSIISATTEIINKHGKIILLEDDLQTSPGFLEYMNKALDVYAEQKKVMHINGYNYPLRQELPETFFVQMMSSWGWATWKDRWQYFRDDAPSLLEELNNKGPATIDRFNFEGAYDFYSHLHGNVTGRMKTWAIKWGVEIYLRDGLCLAPGKSLVHNLGNEGSGTNSGHESYYDNHSLADRIEVNDIPVTENQLAREAIKQFYLQSKPEQVSWARSLFRKLIPLPLRKKLKRS